MPQLKPFACTHIRALTEGHSAIRHTSLCRIFPTYLGFVLTLALSGSAVKSAGVPCSGKGGVEVLQHAHDVLALAWRPDGKLLASATLDGQIYLWDPLEGELQARRPMQPARGSC